MTQTEQEMLDKINAAMADIQEDFNKKNGRPLDAPVDPADLTACEGCQ